MFSPEEKMQLFDRLPALELSYEPKMHKKVYSPLYYIIPKGPKALVWYTYWGEENVCLLVMLNERGNYSDIRIFRSVFSDAMALGTIIYGTHFTHQGKPLFSCEQLYYYKGVDVQRTKTFQERLLMLLDMFKTHVEQVAYTPDSLIVGLPVMTESYEEALALLDKLPYRAYGIAMPACLGNNVKDKCYDDKVYSKVKSIDLVKKEPYTKKTVFKVKADLAPDTYSLYDTVNGAFVGMAMVPTYKCSVMLNGIFRFIKENMNLDLLEESDDETEFENTQLDKFVDLEKTMLMECVFLKRFQKWQPIQLKY
jgi:hypothetical protein